MNTSKTLIIGLCGTILVSSCSTTGDGALTGAHFGTILGSAIGGIMGGRHGSDVGTIVGMATGAAAGAAIGSANEESRKKEIAEYHQRVAARNSGSENIQQNGTAATSSIDESGFDATNSGDDRLYDFQSSDYTGDYTASKPETVMPTESTIEDVSSSGLKYSPALVISNARLVDDNQDGYLTRKEVGKIIFEITNTSNEVLYDVVPTVQETSGNRHIAISPSIHIESIAPGQQLRYTAMIQASPTIRKGHADFALSVVQGRKTISKVVQFSIDTKAFGSPLYSKH